MSEDHSQTAPSSISESGSDLQTLRTALAFFLEDDNVIDRFEGDGLKTLILQDGKVSPEEQKFLEEAIAHNNFDSEALAILKLLLQRNQIIA